MPYLLIQTSAELTGPKQEALLKAASALLARELGKPEQYVMTAAQPGLAMTFAGSPDPAAFLSLKSIGLPDSKLKPLSTALCKLIEDHAAVAPDRVYIEFTDAKGKYWGHDGDTFG
jgi:phenylpyruvate tautomerase